MNYRVIIADDEQMLIELIKELGKFEELGIEIIDECYDGESALDSILKNKPDFVISDIQMPVLDGLEMIEKVREQEPNILFILLSGYRYFEYAQSAIRLNVADYLIKPVDETQLNAVLKKACALVDENRMTRRNMEELQDYQSEELYKKQQGFWNMVLEHENKIKLSALQPEVLQRQYDICLNQPYYRIAVIETALSELLGAQPQLYTEKITQYVSEIFAENAMFYLYHAENISYLLLSYGNAGKNRIVESIQALFYRIEDLRDIYGEFRLTIGVGEEQTKFGALQEAAAQARGAVTGRLVLYGNRLIRYSDMRNLPRFSPDAIIDEETCRKLKEHLRYLRKHEVNALFSEMEQKAFPYRQSNPMDMDRTIDRLLKSVQEGCNEQDDPNLIVAQIRKKIEYARSFPEVFSCVGKQMEVYIAKKEQEQNDRVAKPVEQAIRYIKNEYAKGVSLEQAAGLAGVSSSYLSRVFKEQTGLGFNDYLTQVRLDEAKELLSGSALSIREIAAEVGYPDENYFSKLFRKHIGIRPKAYRRLYG